MTLGGVGQEPLRSRLLIVAGVLLFAAVIVVRVWSQGRHGWWALASFGLFVLADAAILAVLGLVVWRHRRGPARLVVTRTGFGVPPEVPPGLIAMVWIGLVTMQVSIAAAAWRVPEPDPVVVVMSYVFLGFMCIVGVVEVAATVVAIWAAWQGFVFEVTPAGIRSRALLLYRFIPWEALAPGGPARPPRKARRLYLIVERPDLVVQHGWDGMAGSRGRPALPIDVHGWLLAGAIRWYLEHPESRAAIGTSVENDRLVAELPAAEAAAAQAEAALATSPGAAAMPAQPVRPRYVRAVRVLVYVGVLWPVSPLPLLCSC